MLFNDNRKILILCFFIVLIMATDGQDPPVPKEVAAPSREVAATAAENTGTASKSKPNEQQKKGKGQKKKSDNILLHLIESVEDLVKVIL